MRHEHWKDVDPPIPRLPWTRLEIALLIATSLVLLVGISAFALVWHSSPAWGRANLRYVLVLCACYALLAFEAARPPLYGRGGPVVPVTRANVARQARILRNVILWVGLEAQCLVAVFLSRSPAGTLGPMGTALTDPDIFRNLIAVVCSAPLITVIAGLIAAYRAR